MVAARFRATPAQAFALGSLLLGTSACGSFDPVTQTRFTLLDAQTFESLDMLGAHWVAYDDQHSLTAACTNGAAGDHDPEECSNIYQPHFDWPRSKCPPLPAELDEGRMAQPEPGGSLCIHGQLSAMTICKNPDKQCYDANDVGDVSNMWGAGVGLAFSADGKTPWLAHEHGVRGVAFDLSLSGDTTLAVDSTSPSELNLRVEVPLLLPAATPVPDMRPLMREDGRVIGTNGKLYDCAAGELEDSFDRGQTTLGSVLLKPAETVTSELHPYGSPFWQKSASSDWGPSPVRLGHNEFEWRDVFPPPQNDRYRYPIDHAQMPILGVHFQVVHPKLGNTVPLAFVVCIKNLALLLE
ncbi:MAG TPA: hypothetical protein VGC79_18305 [Polyangiaceae bacterium]